MEQTECSETSAYKIQTPGNYPEEHGECLKSRILPLCLFSLIKKHVTKNRAIPAVLVTGRMYVIF